MAEKEKEDKPDVIQVTTAKRHRVLQDISHEMGGTLISDTVEVAGHKYYMTTLDTDEEVWADSHQNINSPVSAVTSMKPPVLAAAIKSIDGVPVSELFEFSENAPTADVEFHNSSEYRKRYWQMTQLLLWLGEKPQLLISDLWSEYIKLLERRDTVWDELKKSCAKTPGGNSKATSSPERESSQATQM